MREGGDLRFKKIEPCNLPDTELSSTQHHHAGTGSRGTFKAAPCVRTCARWTLQTASLSTVLSILEVGTWKNALFYAVFELPFVLKNVI